MGRQWHSAAGLGLYVSVLFRPERPLREATRWTLAAALAACQACRAVDGCQVEIEWPNDLQFQGRKLGGILTEMRSAGRSPRELIIGLGLNVHHAEVDFPPALRSIATSLRLAGGRGEPDGELLAAKYISGLGELSGRLERGAWDEIAVEWQRLAPGCKGRAVRVDPEGFQGRTCGIDAEGGLLVRNGEGVTIAVRMADAVVPVEN
jgi:BirA family biotin operon repressor/biotin-[acetyl-CoA-carboxylase] ligase